MKTNMASYRALYRVETESVYQTVHQDVAAAMRVAVLWGVDKVVRNRVNLAMDVAEYRAVYRDPPHPAILDFLAAAGTGTP